MVRSHFIWSGRGGRSQATLRCERPPRLRRFGSFAIFSYWRSHPSSVRRGIYLFWKVSEESLTTVESADMLSREAAEKDSLIWVRLTEYLWPLRCLRAKRA
jgi:hypothetical protein